MKKILNDPVMIAQCMVLFKVFDGDPHQWVSYIEQSGSQEQREVDLPFAQWLLCHSEHDGDFLRDLALVVHHSNVEH